MNKEVIIDLLDPSLIVHHPLSASAGFVAEQLNPAKSIS
jgi:hypothetical protein